MAFRRSDLQEAFFIPGTYPFRVWGYGTTDPLEQVLAPDYFATVRGLLRAGELIYVSMRVRATPGSRGELGEPHVALVMVRAEGRERERAAGSVRLVQDFGRPSDAANALSAAAPGSASAPAPVAPGKRGRGRPPGSGTKTPA